MADFDTVYYEQPIDGNLLKSYAPPVDGVGFVGSYTPLTPAGQMGLWNVNTYFLQTDRRSELSGPTTCRTPGYLNR